MSIFAEAAEAHFLPQIKELEDRVAHLTAQNAKLYADAERFRWLTKNTTWCESDKLNSPIAGFGNRVWFHVSSNWADTLAGAIDEAMKEVMLDKSNKQSSPVGPGDASGDNTPF